MSKEERFKTLFDGNKWLVADKENDTLLGGFGAGKMLNEFVRKVADLEAKLAECEADKNALICDYESRITKEQELMSWLEHKNEELKQQLAEKDAEIRVAYSFRKQKCDNLQKALAEKEEEFMQVVKDWKSLVESKNQDKISFCIERLVNIQKYISDSPVGAEQECFGREINDFIDNQIASLKKGVE